MLTSIDSNLTVALNIEIFNFSVNEVVKKLEKNPYVQLQYLESLINTSQRKELDPDLVLKKYITLLCKYQPQKVLDALRLREDYPSDECLEICRESNVRSACAYLYEELGAIKESFDIHIEFIKEKLQMLVDLMILKEPISSSLINDLLKTYLDTLYLCKRSVNRLDTIDNEEN